MQTKTLGSLIVTLLTALVWLAVPAGTPAVAANGPQITPGVQMFTKGAQCTANFVFTDRADRMYVGYAAHCAGKGEATDTNGCATDSQPLGTKVRFAEGATLATSGTTLGRGTLVYSSWEAMRSVGTSEQNACAANDFALVRVKAKHAGRVNPTVPFFGGTDRPRRRRRCRQPGLLLRTVQPAPHDHALAEDRTVARLDVRRVGDRRLHRHSRHPGRLGQRLPRRPGSRGRHPLHRRDRPAGRLQRPGQPRRVSWPSPSSTPASPVCDWSRVARSRPSPDPTLGWRS